MVSALQRGSRGSFVLWAVLTLTASPLAFLMLALLLGAVAISGRTDGRRLLVSLTKAGQQLAEKAAPNALAISRETLAPLEPKEREVLMELLHKLR